MTRQRLLLIVQAPEKGLRTAPLAGTSGKHLAALANLDLDDLLARFEVVALQKDWGGDGPHAPAQFDVAAAREVADQLRTKWAGRRAVFLGREVAMAFRLIPTDFEWFAPIEIHPNIEVAVMPRPQGMQNWWLDEENVKRAQDFMIRVKLGAFEIKRASPRGRAAGQLERFSPEQVAVALEAGRGIHTWAANLLAETTGIRVHTQTIANYIERYPALAQIVEHQRTRIVHTAQHNIVADIEAGGVDSSWKLMRSRIGQGSGFELQRITVDGEIKHDHRHEHHLVVEDMRASLLQEIDQHATLIEHDSAQTSGPSTGKRGKNGSSR